MLGGKFLNYFITEELYGEYNFLIQSAWGVYPWVFKSVINSKKQFVEHLKIITSLKDLYSILRPSVGKKKTNSKQPTQLELSLENIESVQQLKHCISKNHMLLNFHSFLNLLYNNLFVMGKNILH